MESHSVTIVCDTLVGSCLLRQCHVTTKHCLHTSPVVLRRNFLRALVVDNDSLKKIEKQINKENLNCRYRTVNALLFEEFITLASFLPFYVRQKLKRQKSSLLELQYFSLGP